MENQGTYQEAKKRAGAKLSLYIHLSAYIAVNTLLMVVNLSTSTQYLWFKWPLIGWGIGVFFHALGVFIFPGKSSVPEWMIEKEMRIETLKSGRSRTGE
jgi:hypothetical protein